MAKFNDADTALIAKASNQVLASGDGEDELEFDYSDYGGLPARIYRRFSPGQVDALQEAIQITAKVKLGKSTIGHLLTGHHLKPGQSERHSAPSEELPAPIESYKW